MLRGKRFYCDTETTGVNAKQNGVIQVAFKFFIDGNLVEAHNIKVQPFPDDIIEDSALEANGITKEELFSPDRLTPQQAYLKIITILDAHIAKFDRADKAFFLGYKAQFDFDFLWEWFRKCGNNYFGSYFFSPPLCLMMLAGFLLQGSRAEMDSFKLIKVWEFLYPDDILKHPDESWHDALFDIDRTIEIEEALRNIVRGIRKSEPASR